MTVSGVPLAKGLSLVAAYRAERLNQRAVLRGSLQQLRMARQAARTEEADEQAAMMTPASPSDDVALVPETTGMPPSGSVFASLVSSAASERQDTSRGGFAATEPAMPTKSARAMITDAPLSEIGFGPGMLLRLSQLGLHTTADLARADAKQLRAELGEISRLVDVETWITHARQMTSRL